MPYVKNNLISRPGYSGMGDFWDSITSAAGGVLKFYGTEQQAVGAAAATAQQNRDLTTALLARQGMGMDTILIVGGLGLAAFMLLRKKS